MLQPEGHEVTLACSGEEALALMEQNGTFDLVISDVSMGAGMSGWDLADHIREQWPQIPAVLSPDGARRSTPSKRARGVAGVLAKPFRVGELRELVAMLTAGAAVGASA